MKTAIDGTKGRESLEMESPVGRLRLTAGAGVLVGVEFIRGGAPARESSEAAVLLEARRQLEEYFRGERTAFQLPLTPAGTEFQQQVWRALLDIPFGETWSYQRLAEAIGKPAAVRAVGAANGRNPLAIVIPCHRVIGADGTLTGYGGGMENKAWLLEHEAGRGAQGLLPLDVTPTRRPALATPRAAR